MLNSAYHDLLLASQGSLVVRQGLSTGMYVCNFHKNVHIWVKKALSGQICTYILYYCPFLLNPEKWCTPKLWIEKEKKQQQQQQHTDPRFVMFYLQLTS